VVATVCNSSIHYLIRGEQHYFSPFLPGDEQYSMSYLFPALGINPKPTIKVLQSKLEAILRRLSLSREAARRMHSVTITPVIHFERAKI